MKTIKPTKAWILICSIIIVSNAAEYGTPHHDGSHLGDSIPWKKHQNRIIPVEVQTPDHVLSAPELACLSADDNIFDIMNQAQEECNGTDIRCTFYHFVNHSYDNIGTVDINKERFDDLLLKFDNWLLTDEHIETNGGKIKEDHVLEPTYAGLNEHSSIPSDLKGVDVSQSKHIDVLDHRSNESGDERANPHHIKPPHETHHKNHHNKDHNSDAAQHFKKYLKDSNHIVIEPEYNSEHKYFEVFIPKDKFTGKPRTIYVEVDQHKNEFVLLDEGVDKKLKGIKPIRIELDELSDIADTAFNELTKSSDFKEHVHHHLNDDEKAVISDISSGVHEHKIHLDADVSEHIMHDTINPEVHQPNINAIDAKQVLIADDKTGKEKKVLNVIRSLIVPNRYINQSQFQVETHLDNTTDHNIINNHLLESNNDTDNNQVTFHEEEFPLNSLEYNENNIDINSEIRHDTNIEISSPEHSDISNENNNNTTEYRDLSIDHENFTYNDDHLIELEENKNTYHDINSDDRHKISAPNAFDLNVPTSQIKKTTPKEFIINIDPELNPSVATGISDYSGSRFHAIPTENRQQGDIFNLPLEPPSNISPEPRTIFATVPILREDSAKVLKTNSPLPDYGSVDLSTGDSETTPRKSFNGHPTVYSHNFPIDSIPTPSVTPKISQFSSKIPSAECAVKINTESKPTPSNFGFGCLPPKIAELHLPCASNGLSPNRGSPPNTVSSLSVPSMEFSGSSQSPSDRTTVFKDSSITYNAPSVNFDIQKPSLTTRPCESESATPMPPEYFLLTKLGLPTPNTDFDGMSLSTPLSSMPCGFKDAVTSPNHNQQTPSNLQQSIPYPIDLGFNKMSHFENNLKDTIIPCPPCSNRYPYSTNLYFPNLYVRPPQFVPSYIAPFQPANSFPPVSKIPTLDSSSTSLYNSPPCQSEDVLKETKPISFLPFAPNTPFSPLNPFMLGPNFPPCPNVWNKVPYLPCTDRNIRNYAPFVSNYLTPTTDQTYKPLPLKKVPLPMPKQPCLANNLEITPSSYTPCLSVQTTPIQNDLNPSLALEKDLESLFLKYGISLPNILNYLQKDKSDSNTCPLIVKIPHSNLKLDLQLNTNTNFDDNSKTGDLLTLDSTLIGPDLNIGNKLVLDANQFQEHTITTENKTPSTTQYCQIKNKPDYLHDTSLIGPHISSPSSNIAFNNENQNANKVDVSELESSNSIYLDSSLTGPSINMGRPQVLQGTTVFQGETVASQTEDPNAISSEIRPKLIQNQPSKSLLDTSLIGSHLSSLSPVKPFLYNEVQRLSEIGSLNSELTDSTPKDIPSVYFGNEFEKPENVQHEKCYLDYKPTEYLPTNLAGSELPLEGPSNFKHLVSSLIGPELKTGNLPIIEDDFQQKNIPVVSQYDLHNTETRHEENIVVPSSFIPTQQTDRKPINTDLNLNIITHGTELNENKQDTDISETSLKETELKIVEPAPNIHNNNIVLQETDLSLVDAKIPHENSLIGKSLLPNADKPIVPAIFDSSIHLDNSLLGPSIFNEVDSQHISTTEPKAPIVATTINYVRPANKGIDSSYLLDGSLIGPSLNQGMESQGTSIAYESATPLDSSLVPPSLYELERGTSTVANVKTQLDSSLTMPSLYNKEDSSASASVSSLLDSSLTGPSLKPAVDSLDVCAVFGANKIYDSSLMGPHLITTPDSNEKLQIQSDLDTVKLLDSSLTGPLLNFDNQYDQSDIAKYQNPESFTTADVVPGILETTNFLNYDLNEDSSKPSVHSSDLQEMLSKFKNSITNSQLSGSECKPCGKLLPSIAKPSSINPNTSPTCSDLQPLNFNTLQTPLSLQDYEVSEYYPNTMSYPQKEFAPLGPIGKYPCLDPARPIDKSPYLETNNYPISQMSSELLPYAQSVPPIFPYCPFGQNIVVPQTLGILPHPPFVQMKPPIDRNWVSPQFLNIQNPYQGSSGFRPMNLSPVELKLLSDLTSQRQTDPQLTMPSMYSPEFAMIPSSEWTRSNALPLDKYMSSIPKTNLIPSNSESTICNLDNSPKAVDVMSLLDENSYKLLQDMSILPLSQYSLTPNTISNTVIPSSNYINPQTGLYNPQNIPCKIPTPNNPPSNLKPYSYVPSESEFSEVSEHVPKTVQLPSESLKPYLHQSQSNEYPHTPELTESISYPREFLQQQLPKTCVDSPDFSLDTVLQSPTTFDGSNRLPWHSSPPISSTTTNPSSNAITKPMLPSYTSPSSVSHAKPISASTASLPLNILPSTPSYSTTLPPPTNSYSASVLPHAAGPLIPQSVSPVIANSVLTGFSSPLRPIKTMPQRDYLYPPTSVNTGPILSTSSPMYSSPRLPVTSDPVPHNNSPYSSAYTSKLLPAKTSQKSTAFYEPLSAPCSSVAKLISVANADSRPYYGPTSPMAIRPMVPVPTGNLSPSYNSPDDSTYNYSPTPASINTLTYPSSALSSAFISPVTSILSAYNRPLSPKPAFNLKPAKTTQKLENQQLLPNTPISYASNPFLNANQLGSALNRPIQNQQVPKLSPLSNSQVKEYQPSEDILRSNIQIIEGTPSGAIEENKYIYSNDKGDKYYEEPNVKFPLESLSYTLPPEEIKETLPNDNFINPEIAPLTNSASELSLHSQPYERPLPIPLYKKPCLPPQMLLPSSFMGHVPQNINSNIPVVPQPSPCKRPVSVPISMVSSPLLKPLATFTPATNLPLLSPPCLDISLSPYQSENLPLFASSYNSASGQNMLPSPFDPRRIKNTISSNLTPDFSQFSPSESFASPISSPNSNRPYNLDMLPLTKGQRSLVKPSTATVPSYNQYSAPMISRIPPSQKPISSPYISSMTTAENLINPFVSPQYVSSTLPVQTTLQDGLTFYESPINYQPYVPIPTGLTNPINNIFKCSLKPLSNTVLPSVKLIEPFTPANYLPIPSLPIPNPSTLISAPRLPYFTISPEILKQTLSNPIIPSSLLMPSNAGFQTPLKISSPFNNIPRYNYPSPVLMEPLQIAPCEIASKLLIPSLLPQNIAKPITQYKKEKYNTPLPTSPYQTQSFENAYQPVSNVKYTSKPLRKYSTYLSQYVSPSSSPIYTPLPSQTIPILQINKPRASKYSLPSSSVCNIPSYSSLLNRNPYINPMPDVLSYPVSNNQESLVKLTPSESILFSNLRPLDNLSSHPITISNPLLTSSLLQPLSNILSPNPGLYQSQNMPFNSQYIASPSALQLLPCTNPLLENPLHPKLKPLLNNFQNYSPSVLMPPSNVNIALPESFPTTSPATGKQVWSGPKLSISELAKAYGPVNLPTTPYDFSKLPVFKQSHSPIPTPSNSNYDLQGPSLNLPVKPTVVSAISSSESLELPLETQPVEGIRPCQLTSGNVKDTLSKLPMNLNQYKQLCSGLMPTCLTMPQSTDFSTSSFKYKSLTPKPYISLPSVIPKDVELIDTTDFKPISSIKSESLTDYSAIDKKASICNTPSIYPELNTLPSSANTVLSNIDSSSLIFKQIPLEPLKNTASMTSELDLSQFFPYSSPNTKIPSSYNQLPLILTRYYNNQRPQESPVYQSPKEYKKLTQDLSPFQISCSYTEPQLTSPLTRRPNPISEIPLYTEPRSYNPENNLPLPIFSKSLPIKESTVEISPEIENSETLLNKYRYFNKITPEGVNNYTYELKSTTGEEPPKLDYGNPLFKPKEAYTACIEDSKSNAENNYITESNSKSLDGNKPYNLEAKATNSLPETTQDFNVPDYISSNAKRPQRLTNLDHFYENNNIGISPQIYNVPAYNTLPKDSTINVIQPCTTKYPEILKNLANIPTKYFGSRSKLDGSLLKPSEYYPEIAENSAKYYPQNYLNPDVQMELPSNTIENTKIAEILPTLFNPNTDMPDNKYSGYKTYQMPSLKSPKILRNLVMPAQMYTLSFIPNALLNPTAEYLNQYQNPNAPKRTEISEPILQTKLGLTTVHESPKFNEYETAEGELAAIISQYQSQVQNKVPLQTNLGLNPLEENSKLTNYVENVAVPEISQQRTPETLTSPLYSKLAFDAFEESPNFNEYDSTKDESVDKDNIKENNDLKTSLINYLTKADEIKNNLDNNNKELNIPLGNIAIIKKEPHEEDTIKTNNPSIGLKMWKSNAKIVQAELSLKFRDLSVTNFMPVVDNLDKYDMDEIRKIVKNYIDEKYGKHIEIKEPFTVDNQYTVLEEFDHNALSNKYNLLWPTKYV